jgi:ABC-type nitrate/sulfonate/bicarbonate transport system substrate-binding protein
MSARRSTASTTATGSAISRRRALSVAVAGASMVGLGRFNTYAQGSLRTLRMVAQNPFQLADYPALVADRIGAFGRHGIKAEFVTATNGILPMMAGDVEITTVGSANGLVPLARKQDFQFIAVTIQRLVLAVLVKPESPLVRVAHKWPDTFLALRGKKLGVTVPGALVDQMGRWMSSKAGLTPDKDIIVQAAGDANLLLANLEQGVYDAALQLSPQFEIAQKRKMAVSVLDVYKGEGPAELALFPFVTPATRKSFADKNPQLMNGFVAAVQEANDFARKPENRNAVIDMIAKEVKVDRASLEAPMDTFISAVGTTVKMRPEQWATTLSVGKINGVIKADIPFEDAVFAGARA